MDIDFDYLFFYSTPENLQLEIETDLLTGVMTNKGQLFYNRDYGIRYSNNDPSSLSFLIAAKFGVADFVARQNQQVSDGTGGLPERRIAVSQNTIDIKQGEVSGSYDIGIGYIPYNATKLLNVSLPIKGASA